MAPCEEMGIKHQTNKLTKKTKNGLIININKTVGLDITTCLQSNFIPSTNG